MKDLTEASIEELLVEFQQQFDSVSIIPTHMLLPRGRVEELTAVYNVSVKQMLALLQKAEADARNV